MIKKEQRWVLLQDRAQSSADWGINEERGGQRESFLSAKEVDALIGELLTLDNPYHCPHGRPTIIAMTKRELEKKFKRIV